MDLDQLTIKQYVESDINALDLLENIKENYKKNQHLNAVLETWFDDFEQKAKINNKLIPIGVKDNFMLKNKNITAGSNMLKNFISPYTSTVLQRLMDENFDFTVKCNMDEFAMGGSGITSAYGKTISNWKGINNENMSPGGSSSGSAVALSTNMCLASLGTDTGGSVRIPAAFCGLVGLKPTYGVLSRYGIIDFASGLDCPGLFTKTAEDSEFIFNKINGKDENDFTSVDYEPQEEKKVVGIFKTGVSKTSEKSLDKAVRILEQQGYVFKDIKIDLLEYMVPCYYVLACSEAASNLSRYNGIFYESNGGDYYTDDRSNFFGEEVQRRIVTGNFMMFCGNMEGFYNKARRIIQKLWNQLKPQLDQVDFILMPVSNGSAPSLDKVDHQSVTEKYSEDFYTCFCNMLGIPALSLPMGLDEKQMPISIQIVSKPFGENLIFKGAKYIENNIKGGR